MKNSKLIQLFKKLNLPQLKQLNLFLQSPFFVSKDSNELALFRYLMGLYPDFQVEVIEKSYVFKHLFNDKPYKPIKMYQLMSSLVKLIEEFLIYQDLKQEDYETQLYKELALYKHYQHFGVEKWVRSQEKKLLEIQENSSFRSTNYYYYQYKVVEQIARFNSYQNNRRGNIPLSSIFDNYSVYFCVNLMILLCVHYTDHQIFLATDKITTIEEIDALLFLFKVQEVPTIKVYRQAVLMLQSESEVNYRIFKVLLTQYLSIFPIEEAINLLIYAQNFASRQMAKRVTKYQEEYFELYQLGLENKILYWEGKIVPGHFSNIINIGLLLGKHKWLDTFLETHKYLIGGKHSKEVYQLSLARIAFSREQYNEALTLISSQHFEDLFYELEAKRLELKIMYELREIMVLESKLHAFKMYVRRNKVLNKSFKELNNNFIKILSRLGRTIPKETKQIERLEKAMAKLGRSGERRWLLKKIAELK